MRISDWSSDVCSSDLQHSDLGAAQIGKVAPARRNFAKEELLQHMEEEGRCDQDTEDADAGEPGPDGEGAGEYLELGNETSEARQSQAGEGSEERGCGQIRRDLRETEVGLKVVFAGALREPPGDEEKRTGD